VSQAAADEAAACVEITSKEAEHRAEVSAAMVRPAWLDPADGNDRFGVLRLVDPSSRVCPTSAQDAIADVRVSLARQAIDTLQVLMIESSSTPVQHHEHRKRPLTMLANRIFNTNDARQN
jgi:hypothetical protein